MKYLRVLTAGGRDFTNKHYIRVILRSLPGSGHTLVHGDCRGADRTAASVARELGWDIEPHSARWSAPCRNTCIPAHRKKHPDGRDYCPAAGNYRNQHMADLGADVMIVFPGDDGTRDMVERADAAGIRIWDPYRMFGERFTVPWIAIQHRIGLDEIVQAITSGDSAVTFSDVEKLFVEVAEKIHEIDPAWTNGMIGRLQDIQRQPRTSDA